ncbi:MAG TPA: AmmeMemoRadiSam system protein B [Nocardioides sp.]|uniref:AmmeMemoRadiSam system protein B n=1 Tax=Nocardioides sp. TaxID=35761 RepID=UPI002B66FC6B|nr:AmmeMemoRadiSam system protein B [Nocardioides sp.]HQR27605.1 AmmeMemoRadiSam system protein B [Nocardioides sp.]
MQTVRPPAVAGMFYPGQASMLAATVQELLAEAAPRLGPGTPVPKALLLPHAGYVYSGSTAALGYAALAPARETVRRVVLLGPTHRVAVDGLALPEAEAFDTPLGRVPVADPDPRTLARLPQVVVDREAHAMEHSLEVHLPFLQTVLDDFALVPLAVGFAAAETVAEVLDALWGGPETVVVVSSDLSHYLGYDEARRVDQATLAQVLRLDGPLTHHQACGATPANGLLVSARRHGLTPRLLGSCSSGDTAGDRRRVVGYAAVAFVPPADA